jgi:hypothetical protein
MKIYYVYLLFALFVLFTGCSRYDLLTEEQWDDVYNSDLLNQSSDNLNTFKITDYRTADLNENGFIDAILVEFNNNVNDNSIHYIAKGFNISNVRNVKFYQDTADDRRYDNKVYLTFDDKYYLTDFRPYLTYNSTVGEVLDLDGNSLSSLSAVRTVDAAGPSIINALGLESEFLQNGLDYDDKVLITFSEDTNKPEITADNINDVLQLGNEHTWLDGEGNINEIKWLDDDLLEITFSENPIMSDINIGDSIILDGFTIKDKEENNSSTNDNAKIIGTFDFDFVNPYIIHAETRDMNCNGYIDRIFMVYSEPVKLVDPLLSNFNLSEGIVFSVVDDDVLNNEVLSIIINDNEILSDSKPYLNITSGAIYDIQNNPNDIVGDFAAVDKANVSLLSAVASDGPKYSPLIDKDDTVTVTFSEPTNMPLIDRFIIDDVLYLNNGHSWLDGQGKITEFFWLDPIKLVIRLRDQEGVPSIAPGDSITLDGITITDLNGNNSCTVEFFSITGNF